MRPFRIFMFLVAVAVAVAALALVIPGSRYLKVRNTLISFYGHLKPDNVIYTDQDSTSVIFPDADSPEPPADTTKAHKQPQERIAERLQAASDRSVRIMVFGDSQLEGDRITSRLRSLLQQVHGGSGPGMLQPLMPVMYTRAVEVRSSPDWKRYTYLSFRDGIISNRQLGPCMSFCRFLPPDSVMPGEISATVRVTPSMFADSLASLYEGFRLFYGNLKGSCIVTIHADGILVATDTLRSGKGPFMYEKDTGASLDLKITFTGNASPDIYGFSIGADRGIIVDNIPHRGSSGLEFTLADRQSLGDILSFLNPDIIVLHYGLNVVKNVRDDYSYYQRGLERQFLLLRELSPGSELILAGVTDMAENKGGTIKSYANIRYIRDAQKRAAEATGIIFWDAWDAMGGDDAIVRWAENDPPLAQKDYTHLTYIGADSLAAILYRDLFLSPLRDSDQNLFPDSVMKHADMGVAGTEFISSAVTEPVDTPAGRLLQSITEYDPSSPFIFTNLAFWLFLMVLVAGYSLIYRSMAMRNLYLFAFSLFFYWKSGGIFLLLLIVSTLTDFYAARVIFNSSRLLVRRLFLVLSLVVNLGMLAYFKYYEFIVASLNDLFGTSFPSGNILASLINGWIGTGFDASSIILPVGISFFTFQTISYTFDVYRRKVKPVRNILDFGFYVSFFPQLVAGPIVRASEFVPQLYQQYALSTREFGHALYLIAKGLVKKMIISDFISVNFVDAVFSSPLHYGGAENLLAVYGYGLQIYCDFSGYTDIATGVALLLGFRLPVNFNSPYKSTGIADFWRRWHISLSRWLRDYLYIPLGGNRKGRVRTAVNLMVTMGLGGLWHGASWRFLTWGLLHGAGLVINRIWSHFFRSPVRRSPIITMLQILLTFNFVSFAWIFFRAESNEMSLLMIRKIFNGFTVEQMTSVWYAYPAVIILILSGYAIHFLPERIREAVRGLFVSLPPAVWFICMVALGLLLTGLQVEGLQPFIYFRF